MVFILKNDDTNKDFKVKEIKQHFPPNVLFVELQGEWNPDLIPDCKEHIYFDSSIELSEEMKNKENIFVVEFKDKSWKVLEKR